MRYFALALVVTLLAAAPAAAAPVAPCTLVTKTEAAAVLGASVLSVKQKAETIGLFQSCIYKHGFPSFVQIETRTINAPGKSIADTEKLAKRVVSRF